MSSFEDMETGSIKIQGSASVPASSLIVDINPDQIGNPVLKRLLDEVQNDSACGSEHTYAYDRVHNRHNRGR